MHKCEIINSLDFLDDTISKRHERNMMTCSTLIIGLCRKYITTVEYVPDIVACNTLLDGPYRKGGIEETII
jgi:hypothetical protein